MFAAQRLADESRVRGEISPRATFMGGRHAAIWLMGRAPVSGRGQCLPKKGVTRVTLPRRRHRWGRGSRLVTSMLVVVAVLTTGCGSTEALSASTALPQESTTTETTTAQTTAPQTTAPRTTAPRTTAPTAALTASAALTPLPVPKATTSTPRAGISRPSPPPSQPTPRAQESDPQLWAGVFCSGLADVINGVSVIANSDSAPQSQKDGLLAFSDLAQHAFTTTALKLQQLGPPKITNGKTIQDAAVSFFATAAHTVTDQRSKLAALDANDPDFAQKASNLAGPDLGMASAEMQSVITNQELAAAFSTAPECQRLSAAASQIPPSETSTVPPPGPN
jgi:hypothetical protein